MKTSNLLVGLFAAAAFVACSAPDAPTPGGDDEAVAEADQTVVSRGVAYFIVTQPDLRKCAYPLCGGWFVKQVNQRATLCADGHADFECHAAELDLDKLEVDDNVAAKFESAWGERKALVRGRLQQVNDGHGHLVDTLVATEAWVGQAGKKPTGHFYGVEDSGIVCVTFPCPSLHERLLNKGSDQNIHALDLAASGASDKAVEAGLGELYATGILVAGEHGIISGPAGIGTSLIASEFYSRLTPTQGGEACGDAVCGAGTYCCNASCSMCAPEGGACIQIVCQ